MPEASRDRSSGTFGKEYMTTTIVIQAVVLPCLVALIATLYTCFFAIHAVQHVADPSDRAAWLLIIVPFTLLGATFYFCTKYQKFRKIGKGSIIKRSASNHQTAFLDLTEVERQ